MLEQYFHQIKQLLQEIQQDQGETLKTVANKIVNTLEKDGIIHLFGAGHSHVLGEEAFYRAGGLVPVKPIFEESLMLHEGAVRSSTFERKNDYAEQFISKADIRPEDIVFVISTSGRNPVPIDVALYAKKQGAFVVGITSLEYSQSQPSRHKSGKHLFNTVDVVIDNRSVKGDAVLTHDKVDVPFTPTSTVIGASILNGILSEAIVMIAEKGGTPPIFLSGNIDGADGHNEKLIAKYKERIPLLS
ncbi:SIS domain-containing protein [Bacillus shivajii]|uniref:SIS domain-containing protein n=1 Tax=Bacillus shivajii TaxID=1983719 RepID=UPI001CFB149B|nr:SIS domain-containing protein [Bacillus shivajii]UCZ53637.1 SIS domain-containing protein [Bacillus shivajii]